MENGPSNNPLVGEIAAQIVKLPARARDAHNVSMYRLLEETGYFRMWDQVSKGMIRAALEKCRQCTQDWIQYSEDKRTSTGWYIVRHDENTFEVGFLAENGDLTNQTHYDNLFDAVTSFIKHEIENIRQLSMC